MAEAATKVSLRVWGQSEEDAALAVQDAELEAAELGWQIDGVQTSTGRRQWLPRRDRTALHPRRAPQPGVGVLRP